MAETNDIVQAMMAQYDNNTKKKTTNKTEFSLDNYFNTFLPDGVNSATKYVRILPTENGETPFKEMYVHSKQIDGKWKKFACLNHNDDKPCPFCEAREALLATGKDSNKTLAKDYTSRRTYVTKLIDRENEAHGPKFWRFNHDYRGTGILDKIIAIIRAKGNITDATTGRDLIINITRDQNGRPQVNSILFDDSKPLHAEAEVAKGWLDDKRTWRDVYAIKPYEFLKIIVKGGEPVWDKEKGQWADKVELETNAEPITMGADEASPSTGEEIKEQTAAVTNTPAPESTTPPADEDDDLPF